MSRWAKDFAGVTYDVLFQRWICRKVPAMRNIGDEDIVGLNVVVTGCTSGIGKAAAYEFARRDCNLFLACRNSSKGEKLRGELLEMCRKEGGSKKRNNNIRIMILDLSSLDSVVCFAKEFNSMKVPLDVLVNNAGVFAMGAPRTMCLGKYELHLLTNFLSNGLLTLLLLPSLLRAAGSKGGKSKVIMVNSKLHQMCTGFKFGDPNFDKGYHSKKAYSQSKLAQFLFTNALRTKLQSIEGAKGSAASRVQLMTLHPGNVTTDVVRTLPNIVQKAYNTIMPLFLLSPEEGARSTLFAATASTANDDSKEVFNYFNSNCEPTMPSVEARDPAEAQKVWEWTLGEVDPYLSKEAKELVLAMNV
ncbi:NAD(P)-binding domain-containing protein [Chloropicon primus]|nr:NAD(P)-binding domain-containing protein [Chloropicon primus]